MPVTLEQLTTDALSLSEQSRAALAQRLLESLRTPVELGDGYFITAEQADEIRRRAEASRPEELIPAEDFFARLRGSRG
jgi:putative addiction module component (TIGR02574 family)